MRLRPAVRLLALLLLLLGGVALRGQANFARPMQRSVVTGKGVMPAKAACVNDAGNVAGLVDIQAQSLSFSGTTQAYTPASGDTLFLCQGDEFTIDFEDGSENLDGDPNPDTQPGIGYGLYKAPPTVSGISLADLNDDPSNFDNGLDIYSTGNFIVAAPVDYYARNYDIVVDNNAPPYIQASFPNGDGDPTPVVAYLAPVTIDSLTVFADGSTEARVESVEDPNNPGQFTVPECINVSIDQYVTVAFLNPIRPASATTSDSDCTGSFTLRGGVSELRGTADYTSIQIRNTATQQLATLERPVNTYRHGDVVNYTVPAPGDYEIIITDGMACDGIGFANHPVTACAVTAGAVALDVVSTPVSCPGEADGQLAVVASGGTPDYTFTITRTSPVTPPVTSTGTTSVDGDTLYFPNLPGGQYTVTVTDATGATDSEDALEVDEPNVAVSIRVVDDFACFDDTEGSLEAVLTDGGNPTSAEGYTFLWSNGETTRQISGLAPGTYTVTATETATGCQSVDTENFQAPNRLLINGTARTGDAATCSGVDDGTINIPISGGTQDANGEYQINWSDGVDTSSTSINRTDLLPGTYAVTVTDANGCTVTSSFTIAAEKTLIANSDVTNITCFGDGDGSIGVTGDYDRSGATPDYPFEAALLDSVGQEVYPFRTVGNQGRDSVLFANLGPGTYYVRLRDQDSEGCETTDTVTIIEPALLEIDTVLTTDFGCPDDFGTATVNAIGGTAPYSFRFKNDSLPDPVDTLMTFDSLVVDTNFIGDLQPDTNYVVIVTDANGCIDSTTFQINSPPRAFIDLIVTDSVSCDNSTDGQLRATVTPPPGEQVTETVWYRLNPDGSIGDEVAIGTTTSADLAVGFYLFEATITNECVSQAIGEVASPGLVALDSFALTSPVCPGDANGSIFLYPSGGTPPYRYDWDIDGVPTTANSVSNLAAGTYNVTISDANNCQPALDTFFVLEEPIGITGTFSNLQPVSCPDSTTNDGAITFTASDTLGSTFEFYWSTGDTLTGVNSDTRTGLTRGPISVTVTDGLCPQVFTDTITSPEDFTVDLAAEDVSCFGDGNGSIAATVTGGTPGYTYEWVGRPETTPTLDSLTAGSYPLVITDSQGCSPDTVQASIQEPDELVLSVNETLTTSTVTCAGDSNGVLAVFVSSVNNNPLGDSPYTWSSNVVDRDDNEANNLTPGTYAVTVTDTKGCQDSLQYTIVDPPAITFSVDQIDPPLCFGEMTTVTLDTAFGGQATSFTDFTYTLNNDGFLMPADQPGSTFAGEVLVSVFDPAGCRADQTINVEQPEEVVIELEDRIVVALGDSLEQLDPIVTPPDDYRYQWTPPDFLSSDSIRNPYIFPRRNQEYELTVTNPNGCEAVEDIFVEIDANRNIYIPNAFSPNRDGRNDDFRIYACQGVIGITSVQVYNRWGGLVHEATNIPANCLDGTLLWDGTVGSEADGTGKPVDMGVYVYVVEVLFLDDARLIYRGDVSVIR